jgi:hypothetical protein
MRCMCRLIGATQWLLSAPNDAKYIVKTTYSFRAPKRGVFSSIIINLRENEIYPDDSASKFNPPQNPDNKHYVKLSSKKIPVIQMIIKSTISGFDITIVNGEVRNNCVEIEVPQEEFKAIMERERPHLNLSSMRVITLMPKKTIEHNFH